MGNYCWGKRATNRNTNSDCIFGSISAGSDILTTASDMNTIHIMRVYFYNGANLVSERNINVGVEVVGSSTMSQYTDVTQGGTPWIGRVNGITRNLGITFGYNAKSGNSTLNNLISGKKRLDQTENQYAIFQVFSTNETSAFTESVQMLQVQRFFEFSEYALSKKIVPIAMIMCHNLSGSEIDYRNNAIGIIKDSGYAYIDSREWLGQEGNINLMKPEYTVDGTHFTLLGENVMVDNFTPKIIQTINKFPPMK